MTFGKGQVPEYAQNC